MSSKVVKFKNLKVNEPFTVLPGEPGSTKVFIKKLNGVCPQIGAVGESSFYPTDRVMTVTLPKKMMERLNHA